jgi:hypothetical protein
MTATLTTINDSSAAMVSALRALAFEVQDFIVDWAQDRDVERVAIFRGNGPTPTLTALVVAPTGALDEAQLADELTALLRQVGDTAIGAYLTYGDTVITQETDA